FLLIPTPLDDDISALFPLGWAGLLMMTTSLAEAGWARWKVTRWWGRHLLLMTVWWVIGDLSETTFAGIGMIEYVRQPNTELNFLLGRISGLPPTMILVSYPVFMPLGSHFIRWLERGLRPAGRIP